MRYNIIILAIFMLLGFTACSYLDIVPDERPTEEDAFADRTAAENYLYSCYAFLPNERQGINLYQTTEIATFGDLQYLQGTYSASSVGDFAFWGRLYGGIRRCYTLINNIDNVPNMQEELKVTFKAEAKFLIAYYHSYLLKAYGPIIIAKDEYPINIADFSKRDKFDDCVNWIANLYDEAYNDLVMQHTTTYYGRATKIAAKAMKARMLLSAASPLYNGNSEFYSNKLLDPETGESLMNLTPDITKWERAHNATLEAINLAEKNGIILYEAAPPTEDLPYPTDPVERSLRFTFVDHNSKEVIWADTRKEGTYSLQNNSTPRHPTDDGRSWNNNAPTLESVKQFYTENGLPIDEDPQYFSKNEYYNIGDYDGRKTCNLHLKREPRFYSWISFHNGWYEMQRDGELKIITTYRKDDVHGVGNRTRNYSLTGYLSKKGVGPSYDTRNGFPDYPWPLIRLAELYLNLAEAAVEINKLEDSKKYLNKIRVRAGIPTVENSWKGVATLDQKKLREIVRQERAIELFFEGQFGWDIKRWKVAEKYMSKNPTGLNIYGADNQTFFREEEIEIAWKFDAPKNYLLPIPHQETNISTKLIQNPGY